MAPQAKRSSIHAVDLSSKPGSIHTSDLADALQGEIIKLLRASSTPRASEFTKFPMLPSVADAEPPEVISSEDAGFSTGSIGHPTECAGPCKFVRRKGGCKDAEACSMCHICVWRRRPGRTCQPKIDGEFDFTQNSTLSLEKLIRFGVYNSAAGHALENYQHPLSPAVAPPPPPPPSSVREVHRIQESLEHDGDIQATPPGSSFSFGSVGHPHTCGPPCKYARRRRKCKDGEKCIRCHQCFWRRGANAAGSSEVGQ